MFSEMLSAGSGGGSGVCGMIHIDRRSNRVCVYASSQTESKAVNQVMGANTYTLNLTEIGRIVVDATNTDYGCSIKITPTKTFNYMEYTQQSATVETITKTTGTLTANTTTTFYAYYYNNSSSRPWQIELLLWE